MTIVVVGGGPRIAWAQDFLRSLRIGESPARVAVPDCSRASLDALLVTNIDALVLVDHVPDSACLQGGGDKALCDLIRPQAMRFVFAREVARHARRIVRLSSSDPQAEWASKLAQIPRANSTCGHCLQDDLPAPQMDATAGHDAGSETLVVNGYLSPLSGAYLPSATVSLRWSRELFLDGDSPGRMLPPTVEVGGRARILAYGPYLPLPTGKWMATAYLGFSADIGRLPFILEVDTGGSVARGFLETERGGLFSVALDFDVLQPLHLIEFRLISQESAFEGRISLIEVQIDRRQE